MRKNILLLILVLVLCLLIASYFGNWYDHVDPQYGGWITSKEDATAFAGFILAYILLVPFIFKLLGANNQNKWIGWLLAPVFLVYIGYNWKLSYIPVILGLIGFWLAKFINLIVSKLKRPNPPMVIK